MAEETHKQYKEDNGHYVECKFTVMVDNIEQQITSEVKVPGEFYNRVEYGSKFEIIYARSDPNIACLKESCYSLDSILASGCGTGLAFIVFLAFGWMFYRQYKNPEQWSSDSTDC